MQFSQFLWESVVFRAAYITRFFSRRSIGVCKVYKAQLSSDAVKRANLSSRKRERIKLPKYDDISDTKDAFHIREFLSHPSGIESILNTSALQSYYSLDSNTYRQTSPDLLFVLHYWLNFCFTYISRFDVGFKLIAQFLMSSIVCRCILPRLQLLNFEVAPELDLQVTPTSKDCLVKMLSCKVSTISYCVYWKLCIAGKLLGLICLFIFQGNIYMQLSSLRKTL